MMYKLALWTCLAFFLLGCASNQGTVGQTFLHDDGHQELRNSSPVTFGVRSPTGAIEDADGKVIIGNDGKPTVPFESILTNATGPSFYSVSNAKETRAVAPNTVIRSLSLTPDSSGKYVMNVTSGTDVKATATAESFSVDPKTLEISGKGLNLSLETLTSAPFDASNRSMETLKDVFTSMNQEQRTVFLAQLEAQKTVIPSLAGEISKLVQFLVAP